MPPSASSRECQKGFFDIPVGDFKVSHLSKHPSLHVHGALRVCVSHADGQDLCASKALALALYLLGFQEEAFRFEAYGITNLQGGAVDSLGFQEEAFRIEAYGITNL